MTNEEIRSAAIQRADSELMEIAHKIKKEDRIEFRIKVYHDLSMIPVDKLSPHLVDKVVDERLSRYETRQENERRHKGSFVPNSYVPEEKVFIMPERPSEYNFWAETKVTKQARCECGAHHTSYPDQHMSFCPLAKEVI